MELSPILCVVLRHRRTTRWSSALVGLLITLLIIGVVYWAVTQLLTLIPLPEPIGRIVNVILIVILALVIIYALAALLPGGSGLHSIWR